MNISPVADLNIKIRFQPWAPALFLKRVGKKGIGEIALFFLLCPPPTFEFTHPEFSVLSGQKRIVAHPNY